MGHRAGDDKDTGADRSADAEEDEIEEAEAADEAIAGARPVGGGVRGRREGLGSEGR